MRRIIVIFLSIFILLSSTLTLSGCNEDQLVVGCTPQPHGEILKHIKAEMKSRGYNLVIKEFSEYELLNPFLKDKELDANFFQHQPYLDNYNSQSGANLVALGAVHFEPLGIYPSKKTSLGALASGNKILVPNDTTNLARALLLLDANGVITLKSGAGLTAGLTDIQNDNGLIITPVVASTIPSHLAEADVAVINGNYAIDAGFDIADALATENASSTAAQTYANIIAIRAQDSNRQDLKALLEVIQSQSVRDFINNTYAGAVVPVF